MIFKWDSSYETHIDSIDTQHKKLVEMTNELGEIIQTKRKLTGEELDKLFEALANYAKTHFTDEEKHMTNANVDERHAQFHRKEHAIFLQQAVKLYSGVKGNDIGPEMLFNFLSSWLSIHILGTDKTLGKQIHLIEAGKTPTEAYEITQKDVDDTIAPLLFAVRNLFNRTIDMSEQLINTNKYLEDEVNRRTKELLDANNNLKAMALMDTLTRLGNRRAAVAYLQNEWKKPFDEKMTITCIMLDLDKFKHINDTEGHDAGDKILQVVANTVRDAVRNDDFVCRLGGDEFVVLANNTNLAYLEQLAEHIRTEVGNIEIKFTQEVWRGSISVGIAQREAGMEKYIDLLKKADEGLYLAKEGGRNRVACAQMDLLNALNSGA